MNYKNTFFELGSACDAAYLNVRDTASLEEVREFIETLWKTYAPYADPHFKSDAKNHFGQRFWEMFLTCSLLERGFEIQRVDHKGPEYYFIVDGRRVWVEAIAPTAGNGDDRVFDTNPGEAFNVPEDKILMRFTHAIFEKNKKFNTLKNNKDKKIIKPDDVVILAINSRLIPHVPFTSNYPLPLYVKAFLPIGSMQILLNPDTDVCSEPSYQYREKIYKENGSQIEKSFFLNPEYKDFTAILHSSVDCRPSMLGSDFSVLHNPTSFNLPHEIFSWCRQFEYKDNAITEIVLG